MRVTRAADNTAFLRGPVAGALGQIMPGAPAFVWVPGLLIAAALALPLIYLILRALGAEGGLWEVIVRWRTLEILGRSALLAVTVTSLSVAVSVPLAWLTVRSDLPFKRFWSVATALPLVIPSYLGAFALIAAFSPRGMLQQLFGGLFGLERLPDVHGFWGATLTLTVLSFPYVLLPVRAAMRNLDPGVEESARVLGHGPWSVFFRITLTQLRPAIIAGALLVALYTLSDFGAVSLLQYETFTWAIYLQFNSAFDRGIAAGLSLVLVALAVGVLLTDACTRGRSRYTSKGAGGSKRTSQVQLGGWRWVGFGFCSMVSLLSLGVPMAVLSYWLVRGLAAGERFGAVWDAAVNSVYASALAAVVCVAAAVPVALLSVRYPSRFSFLVERFSYLGFALPGVVVALALVYFGANYALPLYQTLAMLVFAYAILFLPPAVGAIRAQLLQIDPKMEEAARSLGLSPARVFLTITLPLIRSGVLAGAALVFLITMKELPATLLLGPIGFKTLATSVWSASEAAFFARAALPALLLVLLSSVPMAILVLADGGGDRTLQRVRK